MLLTAAMMVFLAAILAGGCDNNSETAQDQETFSPAEVEPLHRKPWLDKLDTTAPELWLASRKMQADVGETHPAVASIRQQLAVAHEHFGDTSRMIANRSVQLEGMLSAEGVDESALELLEALSSISPRVQNTGGFGAVCQHYFNLRKSGETRQAALSALRARYGSQRWQ